RRGTLREQAQIAWQLRGRRCRSSRGQVLVPRSSGAEARRAPVRGVGGAWLLAAKAVSGTAAAIPFWPLAPSSTTSGNISPASLLAPSTRVSGVRSPHADVFVLETCEILYSGRQRW